MRNVGIIAEYNPFHTGHAAQLQAVRAAGAAHIVVCMSVDAVQRGGFAQLPAPVRIQAALQAGADLVIALPAPWSCAGAEPFARGGVALLDALGCLDTLVFGAETPDAEALRQTARVLDSPAYSLLLRTALDGGAPYATARAKAAGQLSPLAEEIMATPNNNLGVEYCRAIDHLHSDLQPCALQRLGAGHGSMEPALTASAGYIRANWGTSAVHAYIPATARALYEAAQADGQLLDARALDIAVLSRLRAMDPIRLRQIRGMQEGLENRLWSALQTADSLAALYDAMKTKRYAHARLRRLVLDAALGYTDALPALPPYLHVLGGRKEAFSLLQNARLPVSTGLAKLAQTGNEAAMVATAHAAAADLSALCRGKIQPMGLAYTQKPILMEET